MICLILSNSNELKEIIKDIEIIRLKLYRQLSQSIFQESLMGTTESSNLTKPHEKLPKCKVEVFFIDNSPLYRLTFDGILPMYLEDKKYKQEIKEYYYSATREAYDWHENKKKYAPFDKALIYCVHYFQDLTIRDLDNRNRSILLNAIRRTFLIQDDDWKHLTYLEEGKVGEERVEVYIGDDKKRLEIIKFVTCSDMVKNEKNNKIYMS